MEINSLVTPKNFLFTVGLLIKLYCALVIIYLYIFHYGMGDMISYQVQSHKLLPEFYAKPITFLLKSDLGFSDSIYFGQPRAIFFLKCIVVSSLITGGDIYLTTFLFSIFSFIGSYRVFAAIYDYYPKVTYEAALAFLLLPTYILWTSGMLKESLANGAICLMVAEVLHLVHKKESRIFSLLILTISGWLLIKLKYYYFGALLPVLFVYFFYKRWGQYLSNKKISIRISVFLGLLLIGSLAGMVFHEYLNPLLWFDIISESNQSYLATKSAGNLWQIITQIPLAIYNSWLAPQLWQAKNFVQFLSAAESTFFGLILVLSIYKNPNPFKWSLEAWVIVAYSLILGIMLGLSITNFGSLERYRTSFYPFLFMLVASGLPQVKSLIKAIFEKI